MHTIIILGCAIEYDSILKKYVPGIILRSRLLKCIEIYRTLLQTYDDVIIIVSGGMVHNNIVTESSVMKNFLIENNIFEGAIFEENLSRNTLENCIFSSQKIQQILDYKITVQEINPRAKCLCPYYEQDSTEFRELSYPIDITLVTSEYHMDRSLNIFKFFLPSIDINAVESITPKDALDFAKKKEEKINIKKILASYKNE